MALKKEDYFVFTSNIDGQFQKAGFDPDKVYEAHGTLHNFQCTSSDCDYVWGPVTNFPAIDNDLRAKGTIHDLPKCPRCKSLARPNVSMFGDTTLTFRDTKTSVQKGKFLNWLTTNGIFLNEVLF